MIEKVNLKQVLAIVGIGLAMCFMFSMFSKPSANIDKLQADTDRSLGTIKAEQSTVGVEIDRSQIASVEVKGSLDRATGNINDGRARINDMQGSINELERTLAECAAIARKNKSIIDGVDQKD